MLDLAFRVIHVLCGVFWAGAAMMLAGFVEPAIRALGPDGGKFMQRLMGPGRFGPVMGAAGLLTVFSGIGMIWQGGALADWWGSGYGRTILIGSVAGVVAAACGLTINAPSAKRMADIGRALQAAAGPPKPEQLALMSALQRRLRAGNVFATTLIVLSVLTMAAARFM